MDPHDIKNKHKRSAVFQRLKKEKKKAQREGRRKRKAEADALGDAAPPKKMPRTLESMRPKDETTVKEDDEEVMDDVNFDAFAAHFRGEKEARLLFTTSPNPSRSILPMVRNIMEVFPRTRFVSRRNYRIKEMVQHASNRGYTNLIIMQEHAKKLSGIYVIHLPEGPTAYFKLTSFTHTKHIPGHGKLTKHKPEMILNNFTTRLGMTVGRLLGSLLPTAPEFHGRRVVTFHNQRDFIFFRHHRYIFESGKKVRMQELGPRFTLKLRWLQDGTFDTKHGEYEWVWKKDLHNSRKTFVL
ncbi:uncharacterized protein AMSG_09312 [Thecamonas trahens ATCC 50062]|uniref:Brix domain-containing protein n=1 Tax=Thecamonas trahens ATCC 50062 TaxID=461836 RepID=A0A0L0DLU6_THETB|nr:hypothetical protein AMSG_09312 [Thecamonas trahens ATCC 50062]KNC53225.1 hypothetical protein AMSG_09312 [Thecamonas trahens ATCC 50062]|eukprot:XP_013754694.1 hypothetical protein AMSG_09312 [Thecamonas trahens ATCC 50062]